MKIRYAWTKMCLTHTGARIQQELRYSVRIQLPILYLDFVWVFPLPRRSGSSQPQTVSQWLSSVGWKDRFPMSHTNFSKMTGTQPATKYD